MVTISTPLTKPIRARALIDTGSEVSLIDHRLARRAGLRLDPTRTSITAVGGQQTAFSTKSTSLQINSIIRPVQSLQISALVIKRLRITTPRISISPHSLPHIEELPLADPTYNQSGKIDLVLGADVYQDILLSNIVRGNSGSPIAQQTRLGWVISGAIKPSVSNRGSHDKATLCLNAPIEDPLKELRRFWELEEVSSCIPESQDERECERLFIHEHHRRSDGRYVVRLPIRSIDEAAPASRTLATAIGALQGVQRRMHKDQEFKTQYEEFMRQYENRGHMSPICHSEVSRLLDTDSVQYLPHHGIWQKADQGRKLRVVFDASRRSGSAPALNERLQPGPSLQTDVIAIMLRWREPHIVFSADIEMMYRQILVHPSDTNLQRIVWQRPGEEEVRHFRLLTLTYGTCCAPYLAIRTLRQLAMDEGAQYPEAQKVILNDTYVDDILSGAADISTAIHLKNQLISLLKAGRFHLRKWAANHPKLLEDIREEDRLRPAWRNFTEDSPIQTLGVAWDPVEDAFRFQVSHVPDHQMATKRQVLSAIARLYDPMGWLAPVIIIAKILMQRLWKEGISWDDPLPKELMKEWIRFVTDLPGIHELSLPRWIGSKPTGTSEFHGFADASKSAYAAVIYVVTQDPSGGRSSHLLIAKTKVAPIKTISIPRMELCAAVLLSRLLGRVIKEVQKKPSTVHTYTDSEIVLAWLRSDPSRWNVFVANRVAEVQRDLPGVQWSHVPSGENPADIASRGMLPANLRQSSLWWKGPPWLADPTQPKPRSLSSGCTALPPEELVRKGAPKDRRTVLNITLGHCERADDFIDHFSSLIRLERVIARCLRIFKHRRHGSCPTLNEWLSAQELEEAFQRCVFCTQKSYFGQELNALQAGRAVPSGSPLRSLSPFLDEKGIIRVGGRLQEASIPFSQRHPVILPKESRLSDLLIDWAHRCSLHGGHALTYAYVMRRAWIIRGEFVSERHCANAQNAFGRGHDRWGKSWVTFLRNGSLVHDPSPKPA